MYLSYYNLKKRPFQITTDPEALWWGDGYKKAFELLKKGVSEGRELIVLTGDIGLGKTTLINALIQSFDPSTLVAKLECSDHEPIDFFKFVADSFDLDQNFRSTGEFLTSLAYFFNGTLEYGQKVVIFIDEAHCCTQSDFKEIGELLYWGEGQDWSLTVVLVGQNELNYSFSTEQARMLESRNSVTCRIDPLTRTETGDYIRYCLHLAGSEKSIFSFDAIEEIHAYSEGNPHLINIICDLALATGYVTDAGTIYSRVIVESAEKLQLRRLASDDELVIDKTLHQDRSGDRITGIKSRTKRLALFLALPLVTLIIGAYLVSHRSSIPLENTEGTGETYKKITAIQSDKFQKATIIQNRIPPDSDTDSDQTHKIEDPLVLKETPKLSESGQIDSASALPLATQQPSQPAGQTANLSVNEDTALAQAVQDSPEIEEIRRFEIPATMPPKVVAARKAESGKKNKVEPSANKEYAFPANSIENFDSGEKKEPIGSEDKEIKIERKIISSKIDDKEDKKKVNESPALTLEKSSIDKTTEEPDPASAIDWLIKKRSQ